ncbi:MAG: hypothetical protein KAI99_14125, partial [Cyclobacteriaceae bacterium]|nr:hypothetical protein [Cyclobacteriaceae bacterium]
MKKMIKKLSIVTMLLVLVGFVFTGCDNNDEDPEPPNDPTGKSETYTLFEAGSSGASGTIKFEELLDMSTRITISLTGAGGDHPAHIHDNSAAEGGGIAIDLTIVDASGKSITEVSALNNGTKITYNELIDFNGYVNVHKSASELGSLIAQGDIGMNALTGNAMEFELFEAKVAGVSGKVTFNERKNGETLVVIELSGTSAG